VGPLLGQTFPLAQGIGVRLRLARFSDWPSIAELFSRHGADRAQAGPQARRLIQFDPRRSYVVCACALIDSTERLVGMGTIDLTADGAGEPDLVVLDPELAEISDPQVNEALTGLLWGALVSAAQSAARSRAA
jgi:hypothetical protein